MEATLHALGGIVLKGLPTFLLVLLLHFYLKSVFFKPLEKVLQERFDATTGAKQQAENAISRAEAKALEYEAAIQSARADISKQDEIQVTIWRQEQAERLAEARGKSESYLTAARAEIVAEVASARQALSVEGDLLAEDLANHILRRAV